MRRVIQNCLRQRTDNSILALMGRSFPGMDALNTILRSGRARRATPRYSDQMVQQTGYHEAALAWREVLSTVRPLTHAGWLAVTDIDVSGSGAPAGTVRLVSREGEVGQDRRSWPLQARRIKGSGPYGPRSQNRQSTNSPKPQINRRLNRSGRRNFGLRPCCLGDASQA
jgi:hypothetical protein